jgi:hypothetical protein
VAALLRPQIAAHDPALARLDRVRVLVEDRDVVVRRPRDEADDGAEAALGPIEEQDVASRRGRELGERLRRDGIFGRR